MCKIHIYFYTFATENGTAMQDSKNISTYKESLKDKILHEAITAFSARGVRAVKMDDIANALSISKRTLYEIYENKEDLLFESVKKGKQMKNEQMREYAQKADNVMDIIINSFRIIVEEMRDVNPAFYSDMLKYPKLLKYFEEERLGNQRFFLDFLHRGVKEGYFRKDLNYELVVKMMDVQHNYVMVAQLYRTYTMEEIFYNLMFAFLRGLCTMKGIEVLDRFFESRQ